MFFLVPDYTGSEVYRLLFIEHQFKLNSNCGKVSLLMNVKKINIYTVHGFGVVFSFCLLAFQ